ncbi:MAG: ribosomal protein S18-alanine N-acetyltransferase [Firmicutes bacterium]|uniref:[Ribosomal protein bS18]-alanine N-acetyltransferase n=1 Tax=Candidatus Onthovivens merdipullorum TaxID=2840889 RepID=A0A9D9DIA0_9BACL|nr:ribosomal protein S18-alanine N-acetyltransferase [Candidatus Onthovivens merdipullorum]
MDIRLTKESDLIDILKIENESFLKPYTEKDFLYELNENPFAKFYSLFNEEKLIGFILLYVTFDSASIVQIAIKKEERNKGFAGFLLKNTIDLLIKEKEVHFLTLEVRKSNLSALSLYKKFDFLEICIKKGYYEDGEDAIYMVKGI